MNYLRFIKDNKVLLGFGMLMTLLSSFGQTFLLALYVPFLIEEFTLSNAKISSFYAIATIGSAFTIPYVGKFIDKANIRHYTLGATVLFVVSLVFMSMVQQWYLIPLAFFGLRLAGQGLFSHISITSMSKYFDDGRGKAISLASLGHPLGEAFLPLLILGVISLFGWRGSLWFNAAAVLLIVPVFVYVLIKDKHLVVKESEPLGQNAQGKQEQISQWQILKSKSFWTLAPNVFVLSFTVTGLFFYQFAIADFKGWSLEWMAMGLTAYAIAGSIAILFAGPLIDKYSAKVFFPFYLIPFLLGVFSIWFLDFRFAVFVYMTLLGLSAGFGGALKSALQVEFFGTRSIGSVRSIFTSLMVMSTAIGPFAFGAIVDLGFGFDSVFMFASLLLAIVIILSFRALPNFTYKRLRVKVSR